MQPLDHLRTGRAEAEQEPALGQLGQRARGLGDRDRAEDLAQEVFLRAFLALDQLSDPRRFAGWLSQITRNLAISWLRRDSRAQRLAPEVPLKQEIQELPDTQAKGARQQDRGAWPQPLEQEVTAAASAEPTRARAERHQGTVASVEPPEQQASAQQPERQVTAAVWAASAEPRGAVFPRACRART